MRKRSAISNQRLATLSARSASLREIRSSGLVRRHVRRSLGEDGSPSEGGFTLIELLTVMVIIAILAGIVIGTAGYVQRKAATSRARAEIAAMETALETYKLDAGAYPAGNGAINSSTNVYAALAGGPKKYMTFRSYQLVGNTIVDPFGVEYRYQSPGANNPVTFDLWSSGPDRQTSTAAQKVDDITNWQQQ